MLWSRALAKFLQLDGFKQNSFTNGSTSKRICCGMLLLWELPAPMATGPRTGATERAVGDGQGRGMEGIVIKSWSQLVRVLTSPEK